MAFEEGSASTTCASSIFIPSSCWLDAASSLSAVVESSGSIALSIDLSAKMSCRALEELNQKHRTTYFDRLNRNVAPKFNPMRHIAMLNVHLIEYYIRAVVHMVCGVLTLSWGSWEIMGLVYWLKAAFRLKKSSRIGCIMTPTRLWWARRLSVISSVSRARKMIPSSLIPWPLASALTST